MHKIYINTLYFIFLVLFIGCNSASEQKEESATDIDSERIILSSSQIADAKIITGMLPTVTIKEIIECTGAIDVPPNNRTIIHSLIAANVIDIRVLPGNLVRKGEIVAVMEHPNIVDLQNEFITAQAEKLRLDLDLKRKEELYESKVTSERELIEVRTERSVAFANYQSLLQKMKLIGLTESDIEQNGIVTSIPIRSPLEGKIGQILVNSGEYIEMNRPMFTVINETHIHLELDVFASDASKVKKGHKVTFRSPGLDDWFNGEVELINPEVSEMNSVRIHGHIQDTGAFKIGSFVEAKIIVGMNEVIGIENSEIIRQGDATYLFKWSSEGFERMDVITGISNNEFTQILTNSIDSTWVVSGNYYLNGM